MSFQAIAEALYSAYSWSIWYLWALTLKFCSLTVAPVSSECSEQKLVTVVNVGGRVFVLPDAAGRWDVSGKSKWSHQSAPSHFQQLLVCIWGASARNKTCVEQKPSFLFKIQILCSDKRKAFSPPVVLKCRLFLIPRVVLRSCLCGCLLMLSHISCHCTKIAAGGEEHSLRVNNPPCVSNSYSLYVHYLV